MKFKLLLLLLSSTAFAEITDLTSFQAKFEQSITDEKNKKIVYKGTIQASQPRYALWKYSQPIEKTVYVLKNKVIMVEPDLEQAIIKTINSNFDFFSLLQSAKEIRKDVYTAIFNNINYTIYTKGLKIESITYVDEFENKVDISFKDQEVNKKIDLNVFNPYIPMGYDIIRD
ncbi:LolA-like outer membrane lipoprotein chaperone [Sulfurimonas sp. C5]|uniref:LolA-like outer membrane lipoprotein chaperone n=1 Tax=Sulfurimonas sp. C5 TaxID=3036947 RepID=UPI002456ED20|nr:LolA-like outer membrane lipoprotein chaperone [Sulfurimonas sp. C5]MDH4943948.1 LolA-like outer membrane lipoprotein chaperone [Sulfurimonas sp. C5]